MKKVCILIAEGFEEVEALTVVDYLRRANLPIEMLSIDDKIQVTGAHGITVSADELLEKKAIEEYDAVVLPGGVEGTQHLKDSEKVIKFLQAMSDRDKLIAAICAAPTVLEKAGLTQGKRGTSYPTLEDRLTFDAYEQELVVKDGNLITSRGPSTAVYFALEIIEALAGPEKAEEIRKDILLHLVEGR